jgi:hypothetical protein
VGINVDTGYREFCDDVYLKKITTRVSQNLILRINADEPKAEVRESTYK